MIYKNVGTPGTPGNINKFKVFMLCKFLEIVHPKMYFTHLYVIPNFDSSTLLCSAQFICVDQSLYMKKPKLYLYII